VRRWSSSDPATFTPTTNAIVELDEVASVWNADQPLSNLIANGVSVTSQRFYTSPFQDNGRYIFTWLDADGDGAVGAGEIQDLVASTFSTDFGYLNVADASAATSVVNYARGLEQPGLRSRTIDHDNNNATPKISLILGDIINSTPTVVGAPQEALNLLYKDSSYAEFLVQYRNRRTVVYAGANDGMLHAFNGGFVTSSNEVAVNGLTFSGAAATSHELGAELWAYVPQNLLPHLKWLTSTDYQHVFYVDGKPRVADVKIFQDDLVHPNGWGTVLVVGMRLGGAPITIDTAGDGLAGNDGDGDTSDDRTFSSAYCIFDITNPEEPPVLLAEITLPDDSLTTVYPTFFKQKDIDPLTDPNQWFLVFGSGPDNHLTVESNSTAKVYVLNPLELTTSSTVPILNAVTVKFGDLDGVQDCAIDTSTGYTLLACDTGQVNSFMGDPVAVDWQLDYRDDALYFGTVGDEGSDSGTLYRFALDGASDSSLWREPVALFDAGLPISAGPTVSIDDLGHRWVFFGTGRLWSQGDLASTESQALFGMKDSYDPAETSTYGVGSQLDSLDLYNATNIHIINFMRGDVTDFDGTDDITTMRVTWLQGNVGAGPYQDWQVDNFTSGGSGISNTSNTLGAVNTLRDFMVEPPSVASVIGDDILTWTTGGELVNGPGTITTFSELEAAIDADSQAGWVVDLNPIQGTAGVDPATRATTQSSLVGGTLFTSVYQPSTDPCDAEGFSRLYGLYYKTGTAHPRRIVFGLQYDLVNNTFTETSVDLGRGFATAPSVHSGSGSGGNEVSVFTQLSTGSIERDTGELVDSVRSGWLSWRSR
jgi:type IV pilus assembly protein PilY1